MCSADITREDHGTQLPVVIDPGHQRVPDLRPERSSPDGATKARTAAGAVGVSSGIPEYRLTLALAIAVSDKLDGYGIKNLICRSHHDVILSNRERVDMANRTNAICFLRFHFNSSRDASQHGVECYVASPRRIGQDLFLSGTDLALELLSHITQQVELHRRDVRIRDDLTGLNYARMPAVVIEAGFLSNPGDEALILGESFMEEASKGISHGLISWLNRWRANFNYPTRELSICHHQSGKS